MVASALLLVVAAVSADNFGELEDLSTAEIENFLKAMDYAEEYREEAAEPLYNKAEPNYNDYSYQESDGEPHSDYSDLLEQQEELLSHGTPTANEAPSAGVFVGSGGGTTKANPPKNSGAVLPAYCDPPNPCPIGYTSKDGCIEDFENTSEFSRAYQGRQNCLCDSEHMFNCPAESDAKDQTFLAGFPPSLGSELEPENPFLQGTKLSIAAKKGYAF
jgi:hypothetical protein